MSSKKQKTETGGVKLKKVFLVTKNLKVLVIKFGDLKAAYPDDDDYDQTEERVRGELEENTNENHGVIFSSYAKAFNLAKELFTEAKTYVNSIEAFDNEEEEGKNWERDVDTDPKKFIYGRMNIENNVILNVPMPGGIETKETNMISARIRIVITEMLLD
jgi:hypothetical protein